MSIELSKRKVWGTNYKDYGDRDWKEKIIELVKDQDTIIIEGKCSDADYNIKGYPFSVIKKEEFLKRLQELNIEYGDDVYLYDAYDNLSYIGRWRGNNKHPLSEKNRYIFISHTATEYQML